MRTLYKIIFILIFLPNSILVGQTELEWKDFTNITFITATNETGYAFMKPIFQDKIMKLEGKEVQLTGYMIPLDVDGRQYVISAYPNASCFFCGAAGKESVVEVQLKSFDKRYEVDEIVTLKGKLILSDGEMGLCYSLIDAEQVK
ncbi:MAG: DUF3299 domain-containing protein [Bacteroidia bacterium]|nr:DUF3299 domain-containing protein [Bacteroidia bacterium]